jgi:hypothetical protein
MAIFSGKTPTACWRNTRIRILQREKTGVVGIGRKSKSIEDIIREEAGRVKLKEDVIKSQSQERVAAKARQEVIERAVMDFGRQAEIARQLNYSPSYVIRVLQKICQHYQD